MRRLRGFDYIEPKNLKEALLFLHSFGDDSAALAGGTDLLVGFRQGNHVPKYLINIKNIPELKGWELDDTGALIIGAATKISEIEFNKEIKQKWNLLSKAAHLMASPSLRNLATVGGNLCNGSPAADTALALIALGAKVEIVGVNGKRILLLQDFFIDAGKTCLARDELLTKIIIPHPSSGMEGTYLKLGIRNAMEIGIINVAVSLTFKDGDRKCKDVKIVLGPVAPTPIRATKAESLLEGSLLDEKIIEEAAILSARDVRPRYSSIRASADYRKEMVFVLVKRTLKEILDKLSRKKNIEEVYV